MGSKFLYLSFAMTSFVSSYVFAYLNVWYGFIAAALLAFINVLFFVSAEEADLDDLREKYERIQNMVVEMIEKENE